MQLLQSLDTELCADSVEFCDTEQQPACAVCACYQLDAESGSRTGRLLQVSLSADGEATVARRVSIDSSGVLDLSWAPDSRRLWCAHSDGSLRQFAFDCDGLLRDSPEAVCRPLLHGTAAGALALSVNWSSFGLAASFSDGSCALVQQEAVPAVSWRAHEFEAWVCARSLHCRSLAFTGGDDCLLRLWDCGSLASATAALRHDAGVTMVAEHPILEQIFLTGSYDDQIRAWDRRQLRSPMFNANVGGGVWRLKFADSGDRLLCAAMYAGFRLLAFGCEAGLLVTKEFQSPHSSIAYGAAWRGRLCLTCSFYDRLLCAWRLPNKSTNCCD